MSSSPPVVERAPAEPRGLLELARAGDAEAFGDRCRVYETRLLRHAFTLCGDASLAEDLAQDTFVEAWRGLRRFGGRCQFFTWLCAILHHRRLNLLRRQRPLPLATLHADDAEEFRGGLEGLVDHAAAPDEAAAGREQAEAVWDCIRSLPAKHQQVIYLRFYVDDSLESIAAALGCSLGTVKSRLARALDKLRAMPRLGRAATRIGNP